ncbi:MAG: DinB family protein [Flavobacteriaceae bacterium]
MNKPQSLESRLKEVLTEGTWVTGTNFRKQITETTFKAATTEVYGLNSIAKLTFHIHYYIAGVLQVLEGGPLTIKDQLSFDAPPITSDEDWQKLINQYNTDAKKFIDLVANLSDKQLKENFVKEEYGDYERNINVLIEHTYYHLGQIAIIKKLVKQ